MARVRPLETKRLVWNAPPVTDDRGRFSMLAMPVGRYEIKASANGFEAVTRTGITLAVGETAVVEITLQPASISARADVKAEPQPLDSQTNSSGSIIAERAVMDLPARGRNFSEYVQLTPSVIQESDRFELVISGQRSINS